MGKGKMYLALAAIISVGFGTILPLVLGIKDPTLSPSVWSGLSMRLRYS